MGLEKAGHSLGSIISSPTVKLISILDIASGLELRSSGGMARKPFT
jgi:hypothetical protein